MMIQPNSWSCLPTAFAMILQCEPREIFEIIDHDGSEILYPDQPDPNCRRGFHLQEMFDVSVHFLQYPVVIEPVPHVLVGEVMRPIPMPENRFEHYLQLRPGVLLGCHETGKNHAVAWDGDKVFDPRGQKYEIDEFNIDVFIAFY